MTEDEIVALAQEMDNALTEWSMMTETSPLNISAMLLARMYHFNNSVGTQDEYKRVLAAASQETFKAKTIN